MAQAKNKTFYVKTYTIKAKEVVGKGAFGVVYKATDKQGTELAAKTINGKLNHRVLKRNLNKFLSVKHENVINIFDFYQQDDIFWIFMQFCCHGDLNVFFGKNNLNLKQKCEIMHGIARGVDYLHSQNIIHRDIKPGNILITNITPLIPKLTDFDLSKSLELDSDTSGMSSNVGTLAYKAPEFFKRAKGKLKYHRNVDVYASGLTFLAMSQAKENCKKLVPRIETPQDNSDLHAPSIGQLIAERIKYTKNPVLDIVATNLSDNIAAEPLELEIKKLIQKMTCVDPKKRLSAAEAVLLLEQITKNESRSTTIAPFPQRMLSYLSESQRNSTERTMGAPDEQCQSLSLQPADGDAKQHAPLSTLRLDTPPSSLGPANAFRIFADKSTSKSQDTSQRHFGHVQNQAVGFTAEGTMPQPNEVSFSHARFTADRFYSKATVSKLRKPFANLSTLPTSIPSSSAARHGKRVVDQSRSPPGPPRKKSIISLYKCKECEELFNDELHIIEHVQKEHPEKPLQSCIVRPT